MGAPVRKKVFCASKPLEVATPVTPINFFASGSVLQNKVVFWLMDNHIFPKRQELSFDLQVADPFDAKENFPLKSS